MYVPRWFSWNLQKITGRSWQDFGANFFAFAPVMTLNRALIFLVNKISPWIEPQILSRAPIIPFVFDDKWKGYIINYRGKRIARCIHWKPCWQYDRNSRSFWMTYNQLFSDSVTRYSFIKPKITKIRNFPPNYRPI